MLPVTLVVWNRPQHTKKVLDGLKRCGVDKIYAFQDGPRNDTGVGQVFKLLCDIDWADVSIEFNDQNRGLYQSITNAVDKTLEQEDVVVLLEDDCVPGPHFMSYMETCLSLYKENENVLGITGYTIPTDTIIDYQWDVYFYPRTGSWGWATWKHKWGLYHRMDQTIPEDVDFARAGKDVEKYIKLWLRGQLDAWTPGWELAMAQNEMYYVYPRISHIDNIGHDGTGVHCGNTDRYKTPIAQHMPHRFSENIIIDDRFFENFRRVYK